MELKMWFFIDVWSYITISDQPWEQKTMKAGHAGGQEGTKHHLLIKVEVQDSPLLEQKVTSTEFVLMRSHEAESPLMSMK